MSNLLYENLAQEGTTVILYTQSNPRIFKELSVWPSSARRVYGYVQEETIIITLYTYLTSLTKKVVRHPLT